jgi:hypothetical protein
VAEGAPLLREYVPKAHRGFESHRLRQLLAVEQAEMQPQSKAPRCFGLVTIFHGCGLSVRPALKRLLFAFSTFKVGT